MPQAIESEYSPDRARRSSRMRPSITVALMLGFGSLAVFCIAGVLVLGIWATGENTRHFSSDKAELAGETLSGELKRQLGIVRKGNIYLAGLIGRDEVDTADTLRLSDSLAAAMAEAPQIFSILYVSSNFEAVRVSRLEKDFGIYLANLRDDPIIGPIIVEARDRTEPYWGELVRGVGSAPTLMNLRTPLLRKGKFVGLLMATVPVSELSRSFIQGPLEDLILNSFVLYGRDHVLAHRVMAIGSHASSPRVPLPSLSQVDDPILASIWREDLRKRVIGNLKGATQGHIAEIDSTPYTYFLRSLHGYGTKPLIVGAYVRSGAGPDRKAKRNITAVVVGAVILIIATFVVLFFGRSISRPVVRLATFARGVRTMEAAEQLALPRSIFRELDEAAALFNDMRSTLKWLAIFMPKMLIARLVAQGENARVEAEEHCVTVLCTDISGFAELSKKFSASEAARLLNEHFSLLATCVEAEGGIIDKFVGDSLTAFWGPPIGGEDHAESACRAAIGMRDTMGHFNERRCTLGEAPIRIRIGIHTGPAIVGNIGAPGRINFTVVGDTVNFAHQLEQMGKSVTFDVVEPDAVILLSGGVVNELEGPYGLLSLGVRDVPGQSERLMVFRLK